MTVGTALAVSLSGIEGTIVQVEADVGRGLPGMYIGGLGDAAVGEAKHRVRTAVANSQLPWPKAKVVVSLSPAHIRKHGTSFDLAIVCAILIATSDDMEARGRLRHTVLIGELGLDGSIRPVRGVLPQVLAAREAGARWVVVPAANAAEAALVDGIAVCTAADLAQLWGWVLTGSGLTTALNDDPSEQAFSVDLADVDGQPEARFALEVAAAGGTICSCRVLRELGSPCSLSACPQFCRHCRSGSSWRSPRCIRWPERSILRTLLFNIRRLWLHITARLWQR